MSSSDVFKDVLADLSALSTTAAAIAPPIRDLRGIITPLIDALDGFTDLAAAFDAVCDAVEALDQLTDALEAFEEIPIAGQILGVINALVEAFDVATGAVSGLVSSASDLATSVAHALGDIDSGLGDVQTVIDAVADDVPAAVQDLTVLSYLLQMADVVVPYLGDGPPAERLRALLARFDAVRADVAACFGATGIGALVSDIADPLTKVWNQLQHAVAAIDGVAPGLVSGVHAVLGELQSLYDQASYLLHKVKPLQWALAKARCVQEKVIDPVIADILSATHLGSYLDSFGHDLAARLGLGDVFDLLTTAIGGSSTTDHQASLGSANGQATSAQWGQLATAIAGYRTGKSEALQDAVEQLLTAIVGAPVPSGSVAKLPDWPVAPDPTIPTAARLPAARATSSTRAVWSADRPRRPPALRPRRLPPVPAPRRLVADSDDPVAQLGAQIDACLPQIVATVAQRDALVGALATWNAARAIPEVFFARVPPLVTCMNDVTDVATMLSRAVTLPASLAELATIIASLAIGLGQLVQAGTEVATTDAAIAVSAPALAAAFVADTTIDQLESQLRHWQATSGYLADILVAADGLDAKMNGYFAPRIASVRTSITQAVTGLGAKVTGIAGAADAVVAGARPIVDAMVALGPAFTPITAHSTLLRELTDHNLTPAVRVLQQVDAFVDPLSSLLALVAPAPAPAAADDPSSELKPTAARLVIAFRDAALSSTSHALATLPATIGSDLATVLGLDRLQADTAAARTAIDDVSAALTTHGPALMQALQTFATSLTDQLGYQVVGPDGAPITVTDQFLDDATLTAIDSLVSDMTLQAQADGLALPAIPLPLDRAVAS